MSFEMVKLTDVDGWAVFVATSSIVIIEDRPKNRVGAQIQIKATNRVLVVQEATIEVVKRMKDVS